MRFVIIPALLALGAVLPAEAATIQAGSCNRDAVASALNSANDGDTVVVPAGTCTWSSTVTIDGKSLTLQGAGADRTIIIDGIDSGGGAKPIMLQWITKSSGNVRLTGFTFDGGTVGAG